MLVATVTSPGKPGRSNEDFVGSVPHAAVLLDGAGIPGSEEVCRHGVAWYAHRLGGYLLGRLSLDEGTSLTDVLGDSIAELASDHRATCDLAHPNSPQATVAVYRLSGDVAEYLVLADCYLLLDRVGSEPEVVTDPREAEARRACASRLSGLSEGTAEHDVAYATAVARLRAIRNQPTGYWIAKDDPAAAAEAVTGTLPAASVSAAALLSNGVSRLVDPYRVTTWPGLLSTLRASGPAGVLDQVRATERERRSGPPPDDATVAWFT